MVMATGKVFCDQCKYYHISDYRESCIHPGNYTDSYKAKNTSLERLPMTINRDNQCKWWSGRNKIISFFKKYKNFIHFGIAICISIFIIVLLFFAAITCEPNNYQFNTLNKPNAERSMRKFLTVLYPDITNINISCSGKDSDYNGYVRCVATGFDKNNQRITIIAECDGENNCSPIENIDR